MADEATGRPRTPVGAAGMVGELAKALMVALWALRAEAGEGSSRPSER